MVMVEMTYAGDIETGADVDIDISTFIDLDFEINAAETEQAIIVYGVADTGCQKTVMAGAISGMGAHLEGLRHHRGRLGQAPVS